MTAPNPHTLLVDTLKEEFGTDIHETLITQGDVVHIVSAEALHGICRFLKDDPAFAMNYLVDVLGVDYLPAHPRFEVVYILYSISKRHRLRLKVKVDEDQALPSVVDIWQGADWPEREVYDMYGIHFTGHPNLQRIYMAPDWEGFPLRKDYPLKGYKDDYNPFGEEKDG